MLASAVSAAYHIRPSYLFLVPLVPGLGLVLSRIGDPACSWARRGIFRRRLRRPCCVPLLGYCAARYFITGHFGLVSFAGYNLAGLASPVGSYDRARIAR